MKISFSIDFYASNLLFLSILFMNFALSTHRKRFLLFLSLCPVCLCSICSLWFFLHKKRAGRFLFLSGFRSFLPARANEPAGARPSGRFSFRKRLRAEPQGSGFPSERIFCRKMAWCLIAVVNGVYVLCRVTKMGGWIANICQWRRLDFCSIMQIYCSGCLTRGKN